MSFQREFCFVHGTVVVISRWIAKICTLSHLSLNPTTSRAVLRFYGQEKESINDIRVRNS